MTVHSASSAKASEKGCQLPLPVSLKMNSKCLLGVSISLMA
jgi:hypothetical protein